MGTICTMIYTVYKDFQILDHDLRSDVLSQEAAVSQQPRPELDPHNTKNEKDEEAQEKDVPQHGQSVQQQCHQDPHTCTKRHIRLLYISSVNNRTANNVAFTMSLVVTTHNDNLYRL